MQFKAFKPYNLAEHTLIIVNCIVFFEKYHEEYGFMGVCECVCVLLCLIKAIAPTFFTLLRHTVNNRDFPEMQKCIAKYEKVDSKNS